MKHFLAALVPTDLILLVDESERNLGRQSHGKMIKVMTCHDDSMRAFDQSIAESGCDGSIDFLVQLGFLLDSEVSDDLHNVFLSRSGRHPFWNRCKISYQSHALGLF